MFPPFSALGDMTNKYTQVYDGMVMKRGIRFIYIFRHFNLTPVRNLDCTSSLQPAPVLLHLPVCNGSDKSPSHDEK